MVNFARATRGGANFATKIFALVVMLATSMVLQLTVAPVAEAVVLTQEDARNMGKPQLGPNDAAGFEVVWYGLYNVAQMRKVDDPKAPARSKGIVVGGNTPILERVTMRIPAKPGTNFGVAFRFRNAPEDTPVDYRAVWRFPKPGLVNPTNMNAFLQYETTPSVCQVNICVYGWAFSEPWEMVTGTWTLELWRGTRKLHEQMFEVVSQ